MTSSTELPLSALEEDCSFQQCKNNNKCFGPLFSFIQYYVQNVTCLD